MSKFIQLEYGWYDDQNRVSTGMVIINLDMVMVDNIDMKRLTLRSDLSYNLSERGWAVLMEAMIDKGEQDV